MKNQLAKAGKKQTIEISTVLKSPELRKKLQTYVDETLVCKTKILDQQESIKSIRDAAIEELSIEPKVFNSIVSLYFNNDFDKKQDELERMLEVIETLTGKSGE